MSTARGGTTAARNSAAAAGYAAKKRDQLEKAAEARAQRAAAQSGPDEPRQAPSTVAVGMPRRSELDQLHAAYDAKTSGPSRSSAARSHEANDRYMDDFHSAYDALAAKQGLPPVRAPAANIGLGQDMSGIVGQLSSITISELGAQWRAGPRNEAGHLVDLSDRPLLCMALSLDRNEAAIGGSDHAVYTIDLKSGRKGRTLYTKKYGHTEWVTDVAYMPDGRILSAGMDSKLCVWDRTGVRCSDLVGHSSSISAVRTCGPNSAVSAGYDKTVRIWDLARGTDVVKLTQHKDPVVVLAVAPGRCVSLQFACTSTLTTTVPRRHAYHSPKVPLQCPLQHPYS